MNFYLQVFYIHTQVQVLTEFFQEQSLVFEGMENPMITLQYTVTVANVYNSYVAS